MATFGERVKKLRKEKGFTQDQLAEQFLLNKSSISRYEKDKQMPEFDMMLKLADFFNVSIDFLIGRSKESTVDLSDQIPQGELVRIPVLGTIRAGEPMFAEQNIVEYRSADLTLIPKTNLSDLFYLKIQGNSMNLSGMPEGAYILVRKQECVENGEIGVVIVDGDEATVKKVYCEGSFVTLFPNSSDPSFEPLMIDTTKEFVQVVGKVVGSWTQY